MNTDNQSRIAHEEVLRPTTALTVLEVELAWLIEESLIYLHSTPNSRDGTHPAVLTSDVGINWDYVFTNASEYLQEHIRRTGSLDGRPLARLVRMANPEVNAAFQQLRFDVAHKMLHLQYRRKETMRLLPSHDLLHRLDLLKVHKRRLRSRSSSSRSTTAYTHCVAKTYYPYLDLAYNANVVYKYYSQPGCKKGSAVIDIEFAPQRRSEYGGNLKNPNDVNFKRPPESLTYYPNSNQPGCKKGSHALDIGFDHAHTKTPIMAGYVSIVQYDNLKTKHDIAQSELEKLERHCEELKKHIHEQEARLKKHTEDQKKLAIKVEQLDDNYRDLLMDHGDNKDHVQEYNDGSNEEQK